MEPVACPFCLEPMKQEERDPAETPDDSPEARVHEHVWQTRHFCTLCGFTLWFDAEGEQVAEGYPE